LPSGNSTFCPLHTNRSLPKTHAIQCLRMHRRQMMPEVIKEPLLFLLSWPTICTTLFELD
ncbi:hypothetical protein BD408DRAFT_346403, partial [Parasitella parasitica]